MRIVFMGTPDFAVPTLETLIQSEHEVVGVVTQPDRPKGRSGKLQFSPVKRSRRGGADSGISAGAYKGRNVLSGLAGT